MLSSKFFIFKRMNILYKIVKTFIIYLFLSSNLLTQSPGTKFVLVGHIYPIIKDEEKMIKLVEKINSHNADYVFILGDSGLENEKIFNNYKKLFNSKLYFVPGEQELKRSQSSYEKNVGYLNFDLKEKDVRFLLLNSSTSASDLKEQINKFLEKDFVNGPTVILVNHRIWDDTLLSKKPMDHDKSYYFDEIYPLIKNRVKYIFAGNGKRQYFRDLEDDVSYGKQNVNVIHWLDKIGSINAYAIGMGDGNPKAIFTIAEVVNDRLFVYGDYSTTQKYEILPKNLISPDKHKLNNKYSRENYFFLNKKKFYIVFVILIIAIISFRFYKKRN